MKLFIVTETTTCADCDCVVPLEEHVDMPLCQVCGQARADSVMEYFAERFGEEE